jgi:cyclophilin family peptidyl-prolyl cis-trans isomerase/HEAT repeat protein
MAADLPGHCRAPFWGAVLSLALGLSVGVACATASTKPGDEVPRMSPVDVATLEASRPAAADFAPALKDADPAVRARALLALARLERADGVSAIVAGLEDADADVRAEAAFAAGQMDLGFGTSGAHSERRRVVVAALGARLIAETAPQARLAVIRALGRVDDDASTLLALVEKNGVGGVDAAPALEALGVLGRRRGAPLRDDPRLAKLVLEALSASQPTVQRAGAYAALGQSVTFAAGTTIPMPTDVQARIHLARALSSPTSPSSLLKAAMPALLADGDWRVRVEALRGNAAHPDIDVAPVVELLPHLTRQIAKPGEAHVLTEACTTLAKVGPTSVSLAAVEMAVTALPPGVTWAYARCTCAGVVEVLGGPGNALENCTTMMPSQQQILMSVQTISLARISSFERTAALAGLLALDDAKVRMAAADALCEDKSVVAAEAAATRLLSEDDSGVISTLLACFVDGPHGNILKDHTLATLASRLNDRETFEGLEPLITVAKMATTRPSMASTVDALAKHPDPRVRDEASGVAGADRAPGPRAQVGAQPVEGTLPLAAVIKTTRGDVTIAFDRRAAPRTVKNFVELARAGRYNNTPFHRVVPDFVSQGGDPRGDGSGGPGYTIPCENSDLSFERGAVGMAHAGKDTGGSQFFFTHSHQPHLDGRYTRFATITEGLSVMDSLQRDDVALSVDFTSALRPTKATP